MTHIIPVDVYTSDRGANSEEGRGLEHSDEIAESIIEAFNNENRRLRLRALGLSFSEPSVKETVNDIVDDELVYRRPIVISFRGLKKVF